LLKGQSLSADFFIKVLNLWFFMTWQKNKS